MNYGTNSQDSSNSQAPQADDQVQRDLVKRYLERHEKLKANRGVIENHWQEVLQYVIPRKADVTSSLPEGGKRGAELFDSTAIYSNLLLAAALHGMLTNPAVRFFDLDPSDLELMNDEECRTWLQDTADRLYSILNASNFQTEIHEVYIDEGSIGTACMFMSDDEDNVVHFAARHMKEVYVCENNLGLIDTVYREFKWKPRQVVQEFGYDKLPAKIKKKVDEGCDDNWTLVHIVEEMSDEEKKNSPQKYEYKSCYIVSELECIVSESGFREFPYVVPRWTKTSGETYGRGPGMDMLPDIKMVNKMMETTLQGAAITVRPPMQVPDDGVVGKVRLTPGGVTLVRPGAEIKPLITDARIDFGYQAVEDVRKRIREGFYGNLFSLREGPQMTATEVNALTEQQLRLMGPVLGRQHFELLAPMIHRVFKIAERKGKLKPVPEKLKKKGFDVRYTSLVARSQRMSEGQNLGRAIQVAAPIINAKPESLDLLNSDEAIRYVFDIYGVPQKILNNSGKIKQQRDARDAANAKLAQQQQEAHQADVANKTMPGVAQLAAAQAQMQKGGQQ
jgi:hypothetical protein